MTVPLRRGAACLAVALALAVTGCSSSAKKTPGGSSSNSSSSSAGGGGSLTAADVAEITRVYKMFFDTNTPLGASMAILQHGSLFRQALIKESNDPSAKQITAKVSAAKAQNANLAVVTFTIYSGTTTLLPNTHGYAVREGGHWQVAAYTFCSLLQLEGTAPTVCKKHSVTALPH